MSTIIYKGPCFCNTLLVTNLSSEIYNKFSFIFPNLVGKTIYIYNGKDYIPCFITLPKIGYTFKRILNPVKKILIVKNLIYTNVKGHGSKSLSYYF